MDSVTIKVNAVLWFSITNPQRFHHKSVQIITKLYINMRYRH